MNEEQTIAGLNLHRNSRGPVLCEESANLLPIHNVLDGVGSKAISNDYRDIFFQRPQSSFHLRNQSSIFQA